VFGRKRRTFAGRKSRLWREIRLVGTARVSVIVSGLVLAAIRLERVLRRVQTDRETGNVLSERGARRSAVRTEDHRSTDHTIFPGQLASRMDGFPLLRTTKRDRLRAGVWPQQPGHVSSTYPPRMGLHTSEKPIGKTRSRRTRLISLPSARLRSSGSLPLPLSPPHLSLWPQKLQLKLLPAQNFDCPAVYAKAATGNKI